MMLSLSFDAKLIFFSVCFSKKQNIKESYRKSVCVDILMEAEENTLGLPQTPEGFPVFERKPCSGG